MVIKRVARWTAGQNFPRCGASEIRRRRHVERGLLGFLAIGSRPFILSETTSFRFARVKQRLEFPEVSRGILTLSDLVVKAS